MARKKDVVKKIDIKTKASGAPLPLIQEDQPAAPAFHLIPAPDTLIEIGQAIQRSTQAPLVAVALSWQEAPNIAPDYYNVEYSESALFTDIQRRRAYTTSATIDSLKANGVTYYFRVQAVLGGVYSDYTDTLTVITMTDDTPPPDITSLVGTYNNGDLLITWIKPVSEVFKDAVIKIYNAAHSVLYATLYSANQQIIWTAEQNLAASSNAGITSVSIDVTSRSWGNVESSPAVNTTATSSVPATPSPTINWTGDTGIKTADLGIIWSRASDTDSYDLILDGISFQTKDVKFIYPYATNVVDHTPTLASGDPSITYILSARNKLNQVSSPASGTAMNAAPPSGVMSLAITPGFSTIGVTVSLLGSTIVQDFDHFEWALASGSSVVQTFNSPDNTVIFQAPAAGIYIPTVRMVDKFNQKSATLSGAPTTIDALTIGELRAETQYSDSFNTNFSTSAVNNILKNGVLYTGSLGDAIRYATTSGTWNWVKAARPLMDRYKTDTAAMSWPTTSRLYFEYNDGTTSIYYAAPITVTSVGTNVLTSYSTQAAARSNAINLGAAGNTGANASFRYDLPNIQEARNVTLWFQTDGGNFDLYEYYPRRLVQTDDLDAETIRSINVAALGINADRIFAVTLSAFTASMGTLHIDSLLDIQTSGIIFQGTGSGTLLQNATTPTSFSVTGLKIYNNAGVGKLSTYNAGVEQITLDTDGKLKAGAGAVVLDANGETIAGTTFTYPLGSLSVITAPTVTNTLRWTKSSGNQAATIAGSLSSQLLLLSDRITLASPVTSTFNFGIDIPNSGDISINAGTLSVGSYPFNAFTITPNIGSNGGQVTARGTLSVGGNITATRQLSIFHDDGYLSWNNAAGTEKWLAGFETAASGRWVLYSAVAGNFAVEFASNMDAIFHGATLTFNGTSATLGNGAFGSAINGAIRLYAHGVDGTSSNYSFYSDNLAGSILLAARNDGKVDIFSDLYSSGTKVLGQRITGWGAPTGTTTKTAFATTTVSTQQLAERVKGLIEDLKTHGIIGT